VCGGVSWVELSDRHPPGVGSLNELRQREPELVDGWSAFPTVHVLGHRRVDEVEQVAYHSEGTSSVSRCQLPVSSTRSPHPSSTCLIS